MKGMDLSPGVNIDTKWAADQIDQALYFDEEIYENAYNEGIEVGSEVFEAQMKN
tara:strand:+ start:139 stop:300 length:162 start_codon:yes stop_codon:yes gene_type:complete